MYKKEKTIELLEKKTKTLETENYQLHENIKKMTKRNKYLEVEVNQKMNSETKNEQTEKEFQFSDINNSVNYRPYTTAISKNRIMRIRNNSVQLNSQRTERKNMYYS